MSSPTDEQILCVKDNLRNIITFNDELYIQGQTKILNAFALLSLSDDHDPKLDVGIDILSSAFLGIGDIGGPIGVFVSSFVCCILDSYSTSTPVSLLAQMSSMLMRFQKTSEQLDVDFEMYCQDPVTYWNNTFSGSVTNAFGTYLVACKFSDLATIKFPAKTDPEYMTFLLKAQYALDQQVWFTLLSNFKITKFLPSSMYPCKTYSEQQMESNAAGFYYSHPSYWNNWVYNHSTNRKGDDTSYFEYWQNSIGGDAGAFTDGHLNDSACNYLFIDSYDNIVINSDGLFNRNFVFNNMANIQHVNHTYNH
jgi:hypothetical protein